MKIIVDYDLCEANAFCQKIAPEVFRIEEDDTLTVILEQPPEALRDKVERAEAKCPRGAIKIEG